MVGLEFETVYNQFANFLYAFIGLTNWLGSTLGEHLFFMIGTFASVIIGVGFVTFTATLIRRITGIF